MWSAVAADIDIFDVVLISFRPVGIEPRIRFAGVERPSLAHHQHGPCQDGPIDLDCLAVSNPEDIKTEIVYFKCCSPFDEDAIRTGGGGDLCNLNRLVTCRVSI